MALDNRLGLGFVRQPKFVLFGPGQRRQLGLMAKCLGQRALVVTDERMATTAEFKGMLAYLAEEGVKSFVYDKALPDLPRGNIVEAVSQFRDKEIDLVIGIGGGSCMDLGKAVSVVLANGGDVRDYYGEFRVPGPGLPIVAVPTTGGTGAEVTSIAVIFDEESHMKMAITDAHLEPTAAIIDPELTLTCPPGLTAATAADAISHLVEGFTARPKNPTPQELATKIYVGKNRITDMFCIKGLELMNASVAKVVADPSNLGGALRCDVCSLLRRNGDQHDGHGGRARDPESDRRFQSCVARFRRRRAACPMSCASICLTARASSRKSAACSASRLASQPEIEQARAGIARIEELLAAVGAPLDLKAIDVKPEHFRRCRRLVA